MGFIMRRRFSVFRLALTVCIVIQGSPADAKCTGGVFGSITSAIGLNKCEEGEGKSDPIGDVVGKVTSVVKDVVPDKDTCGSVPFVTLPTTFGLDKCLGNNKNALLKVLATTMLDCPPTKAYKIVDSKPLLKVVDALKEAMKAPKNMSVALYERMKTTTDEDMDAFCDEMNDLISPCAEALLPKLLEVIDKDDKCCSELSDLADLLNLVVPPTISKASFVLQDVLNGVNGLICTRHEAKERTCGAHIFSELTTKYKETEFHLLEHVLVPFVTMAKGEECAGMQGKEFTSTAALAKSDTIDYGCCTHQIRPLMESIQMGFTNIFGSTLIEFLNGIVEFKSPKQAFVNSISGTARCEFSTSCSVPGGLAKYDKRTITPGSIPPKTNELKDTNCTVTKKCDTAGEICSEICAKGSVKLDSWVQNTLQYQRQLAMRGPICQAQLPATHNTAINLADGFGNRDQLMNANLNPKKKHSFMKTNNHELSVVDQLNLGVRWLEMDIHYFLDDLRTAHCGGFGSNSVQVLFDVIKQQLSQYGTILWSPDLLGCYPSLSGIRGEEQPTTKASMKEIRAWLDKPENANELIFIYLDSGSEINALNKTGAMNVLLQDIFGELLLPLEELDALKAANWQGASATLQSLLDKKYRVIIVANSKSEIAYGIKDFCGGHQILDTKYIDDVPDTERVIGGQKIYSDAFFLRSYQSPLRYITLDDGGRISESLPVLLDAEHIGKFVRWNVNLLATDSLDVATVKAQLWSWAENEPRSTGTDTVALIRPDGRWITDSLDKATQVACWDGKALKWELVDAKAKCSEGYKAVGPADPYQNYLLQQHLSDKKVSTPVAINVPLAFK
ncbi:hypothetical protein Poli38472_012953 [Pythium oligandrum]|uniref:PLC-like phosphodiesterase n=1 Tax=Pythium oligandrum TaxID=41045 RepID=A0A8K1CKD6_PYTOL|nr:hypothetical protein Poli38472_012953 [Pythium oligandrum]|eukprot:TMW64331.1 hypothetical protein Poli38472_012953 [Pythium oligandrum]